MLSHMTPGTDGDRDARQALANHLSSHPLAVGDLGDADTFEMLIEYHRFFHLEPEQADHVHDEDHPWLRRTDPVVCRLCGAPLEWDGSIVVWRDERDGGGECDQAPVNPNVGVGLHEPTVSKDVPAGS